MSALAEQYQTFRGRGGTTALAGPALVFSGPDRLRYLNGQLTANVAKAPVPGVMPGCLPTVKGKLCAVVFVTVNPESITVATEAAVDAEAFEQRLAKYLVADDVSYEAGVAHTTHVLGAKLEQVSAEDRPFLLPVNRFGVPGFDLRQKLLAPDDEECARSARLAGLFPPVSAELLELIRIEHGVPRWAAELDENTFPSEAGLDRTHVDFHKGCYIGQEVISRLESVGQANRALRGFVAEAPVAPGARLFTAGEPGRELGRLTSTAHSFALDRPVALGYLRRGAPETGLLAAGVDAPGAPVPVTLHPLPFVS